MRSECVDTLGDADPIPGVDVQVSQSRGAYSNQYGGCCLTA